MAQVLHLGTHAVFTGYMVLAQCRTLLASVGASCHSDHEDRWVFLATFNSQVEVMMTWGLAPELQTQNRGEGLGPCGWE